MLKTSLCAVALGLLAGSMALADQKPNIILVLVDDMGWGDTSVNAGLVKAKGKKAPVIKTPNLETMAKRGAQLRRHYTAAPVCAPARASMVTGKHQGHCNLRDNMFDRPVDAHMTLGTVMKAAGYATWHIGKWGIGGGYESGGQPRRAMACDAGFDYSYGYPAHGHGHSFYHWQGAEGDWRNRNVGSPLVENLSAQAKDDPFYAALSAGATDWERDADGTYWRRLVADAEGRHCYDTDLFTAKIKQLILAHQEAGREARFTEIMNEKSEDPGLAQYPEGYCFMSGVMQEAFEAAAAELQPGELSGIVETPNGYHILLGGEISPDDVLLMNSEVQYTVRYAAAVTNFNYMYNEAVNTAEVVYSPEFENLDLSAVLREN